MASQFDTIFGVRAVAALQACHGDAVVRWPCGISGNAVTVADCLWTPDETPNRMAGMDAEQIVHGGTLEVPEATAVDEDDLWLINGECYSTLAVGRVHAGLKNLTLQHNDRKAIARHRGEMY